MIAYFVYIAVTLILLFVIYIMIKAIIRGVEAKNRNKKSRNISDFSCRTKIEFPSIFEIARRQFDSVFTLL